MHANNKNKLNNTKKSVKILLSITILNKILFRFILNNESGKNWLGHHIKHEGGIILNTRGIITKTEGIILNALSYSNLFLDTKYVETKKVS